ncbi:branched-chain amino acid ABC transporter permease [Mesorhizobium sp. L-8-3]|uniref:branched-chain amino acid ABC transporter permease n=1 Tax=Mesorhizobium sp. L-8-3 TaxID=2744522 RepID=UPI00192801E6|nr:branched-chain amino acid ABC transporter permease [Mesorhizobium sp. L-8-3]BCH22186.1 branched-chain amino acid ABC transporter permease [Mesorhizobium sp. L-8-3]
MIATYRRDVLLFAGLAALFAGVFLSQGAAYSLRMLVEATCYAIVALGLSLQWGSAGLFNVGVMGFVAAGAFASLFVSFPVSTAFWSSQGPALLGGVLLKAAVGALAIYAISRSGRIGVPKRLVSLLTWVAVAVAYLMVSGALDPAAGLIENEAGFIGGLGLPVFVGWAAAGAVAGAIAWFVGAICLGLRSDYLAIATLGIAQIIKTFLKNADWLTRGTLTVSPLPWPIPDPGDVGFVSARSGYLAMTAIMLVIIYTLLQRAHRAPWGRMMRAIRDNEDAAASMGKDVNRRRLEIFVFGSILMGIGGAVLIHFNTIFDPSGFLDLNHTFLVWVMVILGGARNNRGAIFGALFVYLVWTMSEPFSLWLFDHVRNIGLAAFGWVAPDDLDSRALSMRVFVVGLTIALVLRYAPQGLFPERISRQD